MTTDQPTLAEFAEAFAKIKAKHPGAPGLPRDYGFDENIEGVTYMFCNADYVPPAAAIALCCSVTMKDTEWWERTTGGLCRIEPDDELGGWMVTVCAKGDRQSTQSNGLSFESTCLAALNAIAGVTG